VTKTARTKTSHNKRSGCKLQRRPIPSTLSILAPAECNVITALRSPIAPRAFGRNDRGRLTDEKGKNSCKVTCSKNDLTCHTRERFNEAGMALECIRAMVYFVMVVQGWCCGITVARVVSFQERAERLAVPGDERSSSSSHMQCSFAPCKVDV
jgi:hypothetical protein